MSDRNLCAHRIERWNDASKRAERLPCVENYLLAITTYSAACLPTLAGSPHHIAAGQMRN
jgi:hypothetical protein